MQDNLPPHELHVIPRRWVVQSGYNALEQSTHAVSSPLSHVPIIDSGGLGGSFWASLGKAVGGLAIALRAGCTTGWDVYTTCVSAPLRTGNWARSTYVCREALGRLQGLGCCFTQQRELLA